MTAKDKTMADKKESFEKRLERLGGIVDRLERDELPLEEGVALFKEGLVLAKACREQLEKAKNDVKIYQDGLLRDFDAKAAGAGSGDADG